jgi:hypothetical protein
MIRQGSETALIEESMDWFRWKPTTMKTLPLLITAVVALATLGTVAVESDPVAVAKPAEAGASAPNTLTETEKSRGWRLLWDGKTTAGWRSARGENFPTKGWSIAHGILSVQDSGGNEAARGGDVITRERFASFELVADFQITPGANSGIKYLVQSRTKPETLPGEKAGPSSAIGCEFQILDDERHPDAKLGRDGNRTVGSLYDLIPPASDKKPNAIGAWNTLRLIVNGNHIEHWLNGDQVLTYDRTAPEFRARVAQSKFKNIPNFGAWADGHILLQDHGNEVRFRNIKLRVLTPP